MKDFIVQCTIKSSFHGMNIILDGYSKDIITFKSKEI